jgi:hypothetical protein
MEYREIQRDDPEFIEYFRSDQLPSQISMPKHANGKKYYFISGEGLKYRSLT